MEKAIKKAIEGGYRGKCIYSDPEDNWFFNDKFSYNDALNDPLFWQALGKQQGWGSELPKSEWVCRACSDEDVCLNENHVMNEQTIDDFFNTHSHDYKYYWHNFIDHLDDGKDIESFFNKLLNN